MSRLAILNSETLLGKELKDALRARPDLARDIRLLSSNDEAVGTVTEGVDGAAFIQPVSDESLSGCEIIVACPDPLPREYGAGEDGHAQYGWLPTGATLILVSPLNLPEQARLIVAAINPHLAEPESILVSPHPAVIALALLLQPLRQYGLREAACWALLPASTEGQDGVDELLQQTRAVLTFQPPQPTDTFGHQLAFNLLPSRYASGRVAGELAAVLGESTRPSVQLLQSGCFHGITAGIQVRLDEPPEDVVGALGARFLENPLFSAPEAPETVGPVAAAGEGSMLLGDIEHSPGIPGGVSVWAVMDNLTVGGAANVVGIIEALITSP